MAGVPILATATIADATAEQAMAAFDYTCRYYLGISGTEFLARLDAGLIQPLQEAPGLRQVLEMLSWLGSRQSKPRPRRMTVTPFR